ncbi:Discoidin domain-containing receptor [Echinococcus granulosus]|uniref:Discoidin domain-containing receptor n=1 Tax=Echinococcus granulosus TaxID=6210 RepID=W6UU21_ECHGR|nr:Discoidin domain-containing receptor [Echinococcus granulosus]EUB65135.1 Discoidin domain-containing receptor [Echinococcus granulosus]
MAESEMRSISLPPLIVVRRGPSDERGCDSRLMDTQAKLPDNAFSASSVRQNLAEFRPYRARLISLYAGKDHASGRAWCPNSTVQTAMNEWIQVDFPYLNIIHTIFTTGRGDGNVAEYIPAFILHYQREDGGPWYEHTTHDSERVIQANIDPRNTARHTFDPTVVARRIRIYPYSAKLKHPICLRFALKGCPFSDGITEYLATEGSRGHLGTDRYQHIDFRDLTNDANKALGPRGAPGGLGKLVDNIAHLNNVTQDVYHSPANHHFVGWERSRSSPIRLDFKFDRPRNFSRLLIFTFESSRLRVGLFNYTTIDFTNDGALSSTEETRLTVPLSPDKVDLEERSDASWRDATNTRSLSRVTVFRNPFWDGAAVVSIPLQGRIAQEVSMELFHSEDWLLISEVQFISEPHVPVLPSQREEGGDSEVRFPGKFEADRDLRPFPIDAVITTTTTTASAAIDTVGVLDNVYHEDGAGGRNVATGSVSSATVTHRQGLAKDQLRVNSRGTTFIIVIVVSLLLCIFCVVLVCSLCIHMQRSRQRHQSLKKIASASSQITSPPPPPPPLLGSQQDAAAVLAPPYQPNTVGVSLCNNLTSSGPCSAAPAAYLFSPAHSSGTGTMYAAGASPLQVLSSPAMFSPPDGCPAGLPSPGHNFASLAGGDLAAMQQLALQQQQFYPPIGMIHPATGGDTTTDSGSLYTTPPALCPVLGGGGHAAPCRHGKDRSAPIASPSVSSDDEAADVEMEDEEEDEVTGEGNGKLRMRGLAPVAPTERNSVTTSSASEGVQHTSVSTAGGGGGVDNLITVAAGAEDGEGCENSALLRPSVSNTNGRRKRPKYRRQRCTASSQRREEMGGLHDSVQSRTDSGVGSSRAAATVGDSVFGAGRTMLQPFAAQPFPNLAGSDILGTEYASTSLFGSSTASNNGLSTMKKGSSSLIGPNGGVAQYPTPFLSATAAHYPDQSGSQTSVTAGAGGGGGGGSTASYHLYQPILVPAQQAHLFQSAVAAAAVAAAAGFGDSQQLGGLVQSSPFLSQGLVHSAVPPTTAYPSETPLALSTSTSTGGGCWLAQQTATAGLKSSSGKPLPPVPTLPLPPNPYHNHHKHSHHHSTNDGTSSGRLSIYSVCITNLERLNLAPEV